MGRKTNYLALVHSGLLVLSAASLSLANSPISFRTVVMSDEHAPGTADGVSFWYFAAPVIDDAGHTAFSANILGPGVAHDNNVGIWREGPGPLRLFARSGEQPPGIAPGHTYHLEPGAPMAPIMSGGGHVVFSAELMRFSVGLRGSGIWTQGTGPTTLVAATDFPLPEVHPDAFFYDAHRPVVTDGDGLFFVGRYNDPGSGTPGLQGLWSYRNEALSLVTRNGDQAPGTPTGAYFLRFDRGGSSRYEMTANRSGQLLFHAELSGPPVEWYNNHGLWLASEQGMSLVMRRGDPAPGFPAGSTIGGRYHQDLSLSENGQAAFLASVWQSGAPDTDTLFAGGPGSLRMVTRVGDQAPDLPQGVSFSNLTRWLPSAIPINQEGKVAFQAVVQGEGLPSTHRFGIWSEVFGDLSLVARTGDHPPGTSEGVEFDSLGGLTMNRRGQVVFGGALRGEGIVTGNHGGIWAQDPSGALTLVVRLGDTIEVAPGDERVLSQAYYYLSQIDNGSGSTVFNDRSELVFIGQFTDGSRGIFVARIPEPATALLLFLGLSLIRGGRRLRACAVTAHA